MKKKKIRMLVIVLIVAALAGAALSRLKIEPAGSPRPPAETISHSSEHAAEPDTQETLQAPKPDATPLTSEAAQKPVSAVPDELPEAEPAAPQDAAPAQEDVTQEDAPASEAATQAKPKPEPEAVPKPERNVCTIEIRCDTVVDTSVLENEAVIPYIPASGVILAVTEVEFAEGESVFDVLLRVTRERDIHMEFREEGLYSGVYIEGINYLYEFDAGSLSGWMYKVNGLFPNYGCAGYAVKPGDAIVWMYTCDLGRDVGDNSTW